MSYVFVEPITALLGVCDMMCGGENRRWNETLACCRSRAHGDL